MIIFLLYLLFTQPTASAQIIKTAAARLGDAANSLAQFVSALP